MKIKSNTNKIRVLLGIIAAAAVIGIVLFFIGTREKESAFPIPMQLPDGCSIQENVDKKESDGSSFWNITSNRGTKLYHRKDMDSSVAWRSEGYVVSVPFQTFIDDMEQLENGQSAMESVSPALGENHCSSTMVQNLDENISIWEMACDAYSNGEMLEYQIPEQYQTSHFAVIKYLDYDNELIYFVYLNKECYTEDEVEQVADSMGK